MRLFRQLMSDLRGATAIEYGLIAAIMSVALISGYGALTGSLLGSAIDTLILTGGSTRVPSVAVMLREITHAAATQHGHPLGAQAHLLARLAAAGNAHAGAPAIERRRRLCHDGAVRKIAAE